MLERHPALLLDLWPLGLRFDLLEGVIVVPLLSVLLMANATSPFLVVVTVFSLLIALLSPSAAALPPQRSSRRSR